MILFKLVPGPNEFYTINYIVIQNLSDTRRQSQAEDVFAIILGLKYETA